MASFMAEKNSNVLPGLFFCGAKIIMHAAYNQLFDVCIHHVLARRRVCEVGWQ